MCLTQIFNKRYFDWIVLVTAAGTAVESALPPVHRTPCTCRWCCLCNGSRHEAPTDRVEGLGAARCEAEADSRCVLVTAAGTAVESALLPATARHARADGFVIATEAAMKLRLIEQGSGCCTVRGGGRLKVRARLCRWHCGGECLPPAHHAPCTTQVVLPLQRKPP